MQIGTGLQPRRAKLAIRCDDGELGEYQTRRVLLPAVQGLVGGLGAAVDRVRYAACTPVGAQGQFIALTLFPGGGHRLGYQRQHAAAQTTSSPFAQLGDDRLGQGGFHGEAGLEQQAL